MSDYQKLIIRLNEEVEAADITQEEKKDLMDEFALMESDSMNIAEFTENLVSAVRRANDKAPQVIPTLLLVASEIAKSRL